MAVQNVVEPRHVARRRDRGERDVHLLAVRPLERELGRLRPVDDPEPVENLCGEEEVRREAAAVRLVVVRHERPHPLEDLGERRAVDRDQLVTDQRPLDRVHDVDAVREVVQSDRIQMQLSSMRRVAGKQPRVPVARTEERDHPHEPDEELVARDAPRALGERVDLRLEALP